MKCSKVFGLSPISDGILQLKFVIIGQLNHQIRVPLLEDHHKLAYNVKNVLEFGKNRQF